MTRHVWQSAVVCALAGAAIFNLEMGAASALVAKGQADASSDPQNRIARLATRKMGAFRDEANRQFLQLNPDFKDMSPEQVGRWLKSHPVAEQRYQRIQADLADRRAEIYEGFVAERARLHSVAAKGGTGKVGYVFVGDVEFNPKSKLDVFSASMRNLFTLGFLSGREPSRLEDHEALIREREQMLRQRFEQVQVVYLARQQDLRAVLSRSDTGGYVWVSHGASDEPAVSDDAQQLITRSEFRDMLQSARDHYILRVLPPGLAKLHEERRSPNREISKAAEKALNGRVAEDKLLYKYVVLESEKVHLNLSYVEHYACFTGMQGAQDYADMLVSDGGEYVGYQGVTDATGRSGRPTFAGFTVPPTHFRPAADRIQPDPDPVGTRRKIVTLPAVTPPLPTPTPIPTPSPAPVQDQAADNSVVTFGGTVPGIWAGGNNPRGFDFKRQVARTTGTGDCKWNAEVQSAISGRIDPSSSADTPEEITKRINDVVASSKARWGATAAVRPFAIRDFKGQFVDTSVVFLPGGWSDGGFRADAVIAGGRGWLIKGRHTVEVAYNVSGSGCWTNTDRAFLESQASAAQADAKSIVASLTLLERGSFTTVPYTGPKLDGSDMPTVTLSPPALERLKVGDTVKVSAVVEHATPEDRPLRYGWAGDIEGKPGTSTGSATITIKPKKPGKYQLSVSVDGARSNLGSASLAYEVADLKAEITQRLPATKSVAVGAPVTFAARLLSSGVPITGNYIYRWQPTPEVAFQPIEGPGNQTKTVFSRPGVTKVWVQILEKKGTVLTTLAESNQIEVDVVKPDINLRMIPAEPYPGQDVRITASEAPAVGDAFITYWWEYAGSAINPGAEANPRVYSFRPKDTTPVTVTAHAKAKDGGDDLGARRIVVKARPHNVQVTGPTSRGPKPQMWSAQAGRLVDEEQQIAVFQDVSLRASVTPAPVNQPLRYQWTLSPDGCSISNPISQEPTFNCSQTGGYSASVTVRDNLWATLGTGTGTIAISISQATLQKSQAQAAAAAQAAQQAKLAAERKVAEQAAQQAKLDAERKAAEVAAQKAKLDAERKAEAAKQEQAAQQAKLAVEKKAEEADAQKLRDDLARHVTAQRLRNEGQALQQQGKLREANAKYRESLKSVPDPALESYIAQLEAAAAKQEQASIPPTVAPSPTGTNVVIFKNTNIGGVYNSPSAPTQFTISRSHVISYMFTYHWNDGNGSARTGTIALRHANGAVFGPWTAKGTPGQGGVSNAGWEVRPNVVIPAGTYTVVDSNPSTWAQNSESGGRGHTIVEGHAVTASASPTPMVTAPPDPPVAPAAAPDRPAPASPASRPAGPAAPAVPGRVPATGGWVLERTEFVVEKVDPESMQKWQPAESGADGAGSARVTIGGLKLNMKVAWTSPPKVLVPGKQVDVRLTISDAGSDQFPGMFHANVRANCPALSAVWYGPEMSLQWSPGERSKEASKAYTPPSAAPGTTMYITAEWSVGFRRNTFYYFYKFTLDTSKAPAPVISSSAPPAPAVRPATPSVTSPPPPADTRNIGTWTVTFNGWPGTMEITERGGAYQGRFNLRGSGWETMLDLRLTDSVISFRRTQGDQRYVGTISGGAIRGTFSQGGAGSYVWTAKK